MFFAICHPITGSRNPRWPTDPLGGRFSVYQSPPANFTSAQDLRSTMIRAALCSMGGCAKGKGKGCKPAEGQVAKAKKSIEKTQQARWQAADAITSEGVNDIVLIFRKGSRPACSTLLRMCSPVFERMFSSGMEESQKGEVKVEVSTARNFDAFYRLLMPGSYRRKHVTEEGVDSLLALSDYYDVKFIKLSCEEKLLTLPVTVERLLQAHKYGLKMQHNRCISELCQRPARLTRNVSFCR